MCYQIWDLRKNALLHRLPGHTDTVTGLELSPDGCYLLSNAMDNSLRIWDVRPYAPTDRCLKVFSGHTNNFEKVFIFNKFIYILNLFSCDMFQFVVDRIYCAVLGHRMVQKYQQVQQIDSYIFGMPTLVEYCINYQAIMVV